MRRKFPNKNSRFAYAVIPGAEAVTYRLSRRDFNGVLHFSIHTFAHGYDRNMQARVLRSMRKELLQRVDAIELRMMGVDA